VYVGVPGSVEEKLGFAVLIVRLLVPSALTTWAASLEPMT
jgi:hypothetical protein